MAPPMMQLPARTLLSLGSTHGARPWGCGPPRMRALCGGSPGWPLPSRRAAKAGSTWLECCTTPWVQTFLSTAVLSLPSADDGAAVLLRAGLRGSPSTEP